MERARASEREGEGERKRQKARERETSGADHAGVPSAPTVGETVPPASIFEMPKSEILHVPSRMRMLRLLKSRCATCPRQPYS